MAETRARDTADINATVALKANIASPTFTGTPAAPTAAAGTNTTQLATTEFANAAGGLVLITSQTFSAVSSVSVNNCFSATYENYKLIADYTPSVEATTSWRFRASGNDNTTAAYCFRGTDVGANSSISDSDLSSVSLQLSQTGGNALVIDVISPSSAKYTHAATFAHRALQGVVATARYGVFSHLTSSSFDGFTIYQSSGTFTGTVRVYGYRNSL